MHEEDQGRGRPEAYFIGAKLFHKRVWKRKPVFVTLVEMMPTPLYSRTTGCDSQPAAPAAGDVVARLLPPRWWGATNKQEPLKWVSAPGTDNMGLFKNALIFSAKKGFPALEACWGEAYAPVLAMKPVIMQKLKWFVREVYKPPLTLCHGDVHMDNIFFDEAFPTGLKIIDFGNFCVAQPGFDAYFLGQSTSCSLPQDARGGGRDDYSLEDCWRSYRLNLFRVLMNVMFVTYDQFVKDAKRKRGMFADLRLTRTASSAPPTTPPTGGWPPRSSTQSSTSCLRPRARRSTIPAGASPASAPSSREAAAGSAPTLLRRSGTAAGRAPRSDASHLSRALSSVT